MAAKHQKIHFVIFAKTFAQLQIWLSKVLQIFNEIFRHVRLKKSYISFQHGVTLACPRRKPL